MEPRNAACVEPAARIHRNTYYSIADSILDRDGVYWNDRLIELSSYGDTRSVIELVNKVKTCRGSGFSLDCCHSKTGDTALIAACKNHHFDCVELLLHLGVDPTVRNASGESVLDFCTVDTELRNLIMTADGRLPSTTKSALTFSAWIGNSKVFQKSLHLADDVDLHNIDAVRNANGTPLLLLAIEDIDLLQNLIKDTNMSTSFRPDEIVAKLISLGADVNVSDSQTGKTAVHYLSELDSELAKAILRLIVDTKRANLLIPDSDNNLPLHYACQRANEGAAILLIREGADVNARGQGGQTALHFTALSGCQDLVRILLDSGADVTVIDDRGLTPFDLANDAVVRSSLKEAWAEATYRKHSSSDLDSSIDQDGNEQLLTRSADSSFGEVKQKRMVSMRSLPVLPAISPTMQKQLDDAKSANAEAARQIITSIREGTNDGSILADIEALLDRQFHNDDNVKQGLRSSTTKPRLRRWRSTSAGCVIPVAASNGVRLPPLHTAIFEIGGVARQSCSHHLQLRRSATTIEQSLPIETSDSESNASEQSGTSNRAKVRLQTTMPCRVALSAVMIVGSKPPKLERDMSVESVSARSSSRQASAVPPVQKPSPPQPEQPAEPAKKPPAKPLKKSSSASSNVNKQPVKPKPRGLGPRHHSMSSFSPERVVTTRPSPPKELPPKFDFGRTKTPGLVESILQPAIKIEPFYQLSDNSDDERGKKPKQAKKPVAKKKKSPSAPLKKEPPAKKRAKKQMPKKTKESANKTNSAPSAQPPQPVNFVLDNGIGVRMPVNGERIDGASPVQQEDDQNSLRNLSDIIQLSTVVEEDEMLASLRSSVAKLTLCRLAQMSAHVVEPEPVVEPPLVCSIDFPREENDSEEVEVGSDVDAESVSTLTPEDELAQMEREMIELGQQEPEPDENFITLNSNKPTSVKQNADEEDEGGVYCDRQDEEEAARVRASSRASSTRNPLVFQEDQTLPPVDMNNPDYSSSSVHNRRGNVENEVFHNSNGNNNGEEQIEAPTTPQQPAQEDAQEASRISSPSSQTELQQSIRWRKGNEIGHGGYGKVFLALTSLGGLIAVKQIDTSQFSRDAIEKEYERIDEEINILRTLKHPSIVEFYGTSFEGDVVNIFMEFIAGGSIASILRRFGALDEPVFRRYTKNLLKAVKYLHANGIVHRDIKGANVMVTGEGLVKLIDFGCARRLIESAASGSSIGPDKSQSSTAQLKSAKGTPYWMAPEVICETGHGRKSDIWSLGCTVFEMATRRPPWADLEPGAAMFAIASGRKPVPQLPPSQFSSDCVNFVAACLNRQPTGRPSAAELLSHKWFTSSAHRRSANLLQNTDGNRQRHSALSIAAD